MSNNTTKVTVKSKNITKDSKKSTKIFALVAGILVILMIGAVVIKEIADYNSEQEKKRRQLEEKAQEFYDAADELDKALKKLENNM